MEIKEGGARAMETGKEKKGRAEKRVSMENGKAKGMRAESKEPKSESTEGKDIKQGRRDV